MVTAVIADQVLEAVRGALRGGEVRLRVDRPITVDYLHELTRQFEGLWFEAGRGGELVISGAAGGFGGPIESILDRQLGVWSLSIGGVTSGSSGGYFPPGGRPMIPDGSWMSDATFAEVLGRGREGWHRGYYPVAPDLVFEVRSPSQDLEKQREKMEDWAAMNVRLGMLIDPERQTVWLYRPDGDGFAVEEFERPSRVSCEPEMPGLVLEFEQVWAFPWVE